MSFHKRRKAAFLLTVLGVICGLGAVWGCRAVAAHRQKTAASMVQSLTASGASVPRLDKFELTFQLANIGFTNPFDPEQIAVSAVFTSPGKKRYSVNGFYYQDFERSGPPEKLTATGKPCWKVRFTPNQTGVWTYALTVTDAKTGTQKLAPRPFICTASARRGDIQKSVRDARYFQYSDGSPYIPLGQNLGWGNWGMDNGTFSYDTWLPKIAAEGGNFARYWLWSDFHGIEWKETGLGDYRKRLNEAWRLDHDLETARGCNIQVMLMLLNHGAVSTKVNPQWTDSPYYKGNNGPCATPRDFFVNPAAKTFFKRRLRYTVARWGYASNIVWELANEIDNTDDYLTNAEVRADVAAWHREMAAYLKSLDSRHLVTTSFSRFQNDAAIWKQPNIDFTQFHFYSVSPVMEDAHAAVIARYRSRFPGQPVFGGEIGFPSGGPYSVKNDPEGNHWHNSQWASIFSGAAGSSALWWWADYIEPQNLYGNYRWLSRFLSSLNPPASRFVPTRPEITTPNRAALMLTGYPEWGFKAEGSRFVITANGTMTPGEDQLAAYLYGAKDNAERRNPPTFDVTYPVAGQFQLITGDPRGEPHLIVTLDGVTVYEGSPAAGSTVSIPVGAGRHTLFTDNTGTGWVDVVNYRFDPVAPTLKAYALQGPDTVAAWIVNRAFNYKEARNGSAPAAATGTLHFKKLAHDGAWAAEWWDTRTGVITARTTATATRGALDLPIPATVTDRALKMRFVGGASRATKKERKR